MNYAELNRLAPTHPWVAEYKETIDATNESILSDRQKWLDNREGIGVGDFVLDGDSEKILRVAHDWGDSVQLTDGRYGSSFYLGDQYVSFSGGLNPGIPRLRFRATDKRRVGACWFFSENSAQAHNGYYTEAVFRVWILEEPAK